MRACAKSRGVLRTFVGTSPVLPKEISSALERSQDNRLRFAEALKQGLIFRLAPKLGAF